MKKILKPTLLLDEKKCRQNIAQIYSKAEKNQIHFRPHFKTHQSAEIGNWFKESGVTKISVSSVEMAEYFTSAGWMDILIAFPVNILEIDSINKLAQKINLHLLLESVETTKFLIDNLKFQSGVYLKIDTGYHRTGLSPDDDNDMVEILSLVKNSAHLTFTGILTHAGHAYDSHKKEGILNIHNHTIQQLSKVKKMVSNDFPDCIVSIGDTPCCSLATDFRGVDEIRPGNFVYYDVMQYYLGSCNFNQIAVALACPIVAKHKTRNEIVIYGGGIHLSKETIYDKKDLKIYGLIVKLHDEGWDKPLSDTFVSSLSQEHGIIQTTDENFELFNIGETIGVIPVHSCLTANLMNHYTTLENRKITKFRFNG
ncbi:MAG: alanine racemase [Bacteroidales bacterium]|nr:alanine racemase [Bacteroidales bacterium]